MKKIFLSALTLMGLLNVQNATAGNYPVVTLKDSISTDMHLTDDKQYFIEGYVYVTSGTTVTIDPGVIIKGDKNTKGTLIFERGSKIKAMGTAARPVVFTSNEAAGQRSYGDWGGVMICGKGPVNWTAGEALVEGGPRSKYGGTDAHDNSGEMHFVRIEFAGIALTPNNEVNGLTLCGVGDATQIDHIQVSYSGDDSYEWFGGTVNAKNLVSLACWDDDFDTDCGYNGMNQFVVSVRDPNSADQSGSHGFESDAYQTGTATGLGGDTSKITKPVFSNVTLVGPVGPNPANLAFSTNYVSALQIRRGSGLSLLNSIIAGWPCGLLIDESSSAFGSTVANIGTGLLQFSNNIIAGTSNTVFNKDILYVKDGARSLTPTTAWGDTAAVSFGPKAWLGAKKVDQWGNIFGNNTYATEGNGSKLTNPFAITSNPLLINLIPTTVSPVAYTAKAGKVFDPKKPLQPDTTSGAGYNMPDFAPDFKNTKANNSFFTSVNYVGAFAGTQQTSDNWMKGWGAMDPQNIPYDSVNVPPDTSVTVSGIKPANIGGAFIFPNPTVQYATLNINLLHAANLSVTLFDLTGKKVAVLYNAKTQQGIQQISFDFGAVNRGFYLVSIIADGEQKTLKLNVIH